jgi:hypothetical protein
MPLVEGQQDRKRLKEDDHGDRVQFWTTPGVFASGQLSSGLGLLPGDSPLQHSLKVLGTILLGCDFLAEMSTCPNHSLSRREQTGCQGRVDAAGQGRAHACSGPPLAR